MLPDDASRCGSFFVCCYCIIYWCFYPGFIVVFMISFYSVRRVFVVSHRCFLLRFGSLRLRLRTAWSPVLSLYGKLPFLSLAACHQWHGQLPDSRQVMRLDLQT